MVNEYSKVQVKLFEGSDFGVHSTRCDKPFEKVT